MRLKRLDVRGFAQLKGSYSLEVGEGRIALLLEENESGKSTLAAAVAAALYGLESDRRKSRGRLSETDRYRPWDEPAFGLSLTLEHEGEELVIERDFERATVRVLSGGEDVTQRFARGSSVAVGEGLTGLRRNQFTLSAFMGQGDLVWSDAAELSEALQRVTDSEAGGSTSAAAVGALDAALANYEGYSLKGRGRIETEIKRCQDRLAEDEAELAELERQRQDMAAKIQALSAADQRGLLFEHRRRVLRARRDLHEAAKLEEQLAEDARQHARLDELRRQCESDAELRSLDVATQERVANARGAYKTELDLQRELNEEALKRERSRAELQAKLTALGLRRAPTDEDAEALLRAIERRDFARREMENLNAEHENESNKLLFHGIPVEEALALTEQFGSLSQEDREFISRRTQFSQREQEERQRLEEELSIRKRRRAELRKGQQTRKHFGIWCLVVGLLPIMLGIVMHPHLPFNSLYLHGVGALFMAVGVAALTLGQTHGAGENRTLQSQVARLRAQIAELGEEEERRGWEWQQLAKKFGVSADTLEDQYEQFQRVERPVDTLRRIRLRLKQTEEEWNASVEELAGTWELFDDEPDPERLNERREFLAGALDLQRQLNEATASALDARRAVDEARLRVGLRRGQLAEALKRAGIPVAPDEDPMELLPRFEERAERAAEARRRFEQELPALSERVLSEHLRRVQEEQLFKMRQELERLRSRVREDAAKGGDWAAAARTLEEALDPKDFESKRNALEKSEKELATRGEGDRVEARAFLQGYETSAPVLRERIDECREALERALQFQEAVTLARDTLAGLARETHADWAARLNSRCNELLRDMESEVQDIHFDESLRLRMQQRGKLLTAVDAASQLSVGALDMVYLAARLAVAQTLSGDVSLPLVLDDPFANADDRRLERGMQLLLDVLAPRQQVILMACQRSRYAWLRDKLAGDDRLVALSEGGRRWGEG